jgi:hypothetical protein
VPHATAAILARSMLPREQQPRVVTTLHGTDTSLLGYDPGYAPAIRHALINSDAVIRVCGRIGHTDVANDIGWHGFLPRWLVL